MAKNECKKSADFVMGNENKNSRMDALFSSFILYLSFAIHSQNKKRNNEKEKKSFSTFDILHKKYAVCKCRYFFSLTSVIYRKNASSPLSRYLCDRYGNLLAMGVIMVCMCYVNGMVIARCVCILSLISPRSF